MILFGLWMAWLGAGAASATETPNAYANYAWPPGTVLHDVDFTVTVLADPGHAANVFWSNQIEFVRGGVAYAGMQTNGGKPRTFLLSVWKGVAFRTGSPGSECKNFEENGDGKTCAVHRDWTEGHRYRFHLASEGDRWFGLTVADETDGVDFKVGSIRTGSDQISTGNMSSWAEYFEWNYDTATCFNQPFARAALGLPTSDGGRVVASVASTEASGTPTSRARARRACWSTPRAVYWTRRSATRSASRSKLATERAWTPCGGEAGGPAITYGCNGQDNQEWVLGVNGALQLSSNLCLDARSGATARPVQMEPCDGRVSQLWIVAAGTVRSRPYRLCLTAHGAEQKLTIEACDASTNQSWNTPGPS